MHHAMRIGSHNVRGLNIHKARQLDAAWRAARLDIVLVQETHLSFFHAAEVARLFRGWTVWWAHKAAVVLEPGTRRCPGSAGVAVLIRNTFLRSVGGASAVSMVQQDQDGRLISLRLSWGGHKLRLVSAYLHNDAAAQKQYIQNRLKVLCEAAELQGERVLLGGDFNFVSDGALDRLPRCEPGAPHPNVAVAGRWAECLPDLRDVWRVRHPTRRLLTRFGPGTAARLDRFYVSAAIMDFATPLSCPAAAGHVSDHRLIGMLLRPVRPQQGPNRRPPAARLHFLASQPLHQEFQQQLQHMAASAPDGCRVFVLVAAVQA